MARGFQSNGPPPAPRFSAADYALPQMELRYTPEMYDAGIRQAKEPLEREIQDLRKKLGTSDGYHTFEELYEHRIRLYIALCRVLDRNRQRYVWKSRLHSDGTGYPGWFVLGVNVEDGRQVTYHLPDSKWAETNFADELERAPVYDGHTADDVLERLAEL